jgi:hypothetical protein
MICLVKETSGLTKGDSCYLDQGYKQNSRASAAVPARDH